LTVVARGIGRWRRSQDATVRNHPGRSPQVAALGLRLVPALVKAGAKDDAAKLRAELNARAGLE
jgi:hypothetical protein